MEVTDEGIISMVKGCPLLESINISAWNESAWYRYDFNHDFVPTVSVTNAAMYAIAQYSSKLRRFWISSADPLSYDMHGLDAVVHGCSLLQVIDRDGETYYAAPGYDTTKRYLDYYDSDKESAGS